MNLEPRTSQRGFTLLEVMIATLIIALMTFGLYRFIGANLRALQYSTELHDERQSMHAFIKFLQVQLNDLAPKRAGVLTGAPFKFNNLSSDEMTWLCGAGHGVLTDAGEEQYKVTLALQPVKRGSDVLELGLRREPAGTETEQRLDADFFTRGSSAQKYNWLPLIRGIAQIKIRYFDPRLNAVVERWNDLNSRPSLVLLQIWRHADEAPFEATLEVLAARTQQQ
jgi:prepilin-type N-terminal cleavage/methylation domain-containing protein